MNKDKVALANRSRMGAEDIIDVRFNVIKTILNFLKRARLAIEETAKHTRNGQREVNTRLEQRINKVEHWTSEIDEQLTLLNNEIDALLEYKVRLHYTGIICVFSSRQKIKIVYWVNFTLL